MISKSVRRLSASVAAAALCVGLAACGSSSTNSKLSSNTSAASSSASTKSAEAGAARPGELVIADTTAATSLDPDGPSAPVKQNLQAAEATYENLVGYKGHGNSIEASAPVGNLATSWKVTNHSATFKLRKGVKDQYGNELTSADVVWSYERALGVKKTGEFIYKVEAKITGVKALGKYEVEYTTSGPAPNLLWALTAHYATIYDATEVKKHATKKDPWAEKWLTTHTAGFGPYDVASFTPEQSLKLTPSATFYAGKPENAIELVAIPDNSTRFAALKKGSVNLAFDLTPTEYKEAEGTAGLNVVAVEANSLVSMFPNSEVPQLKNALVREALQYATPQEQIVKQIYKGYGFPVKSVATSYSPGYTAKYWHYNYDLAKAKALMKQAGDANGFSSELYYPSESQELAAIAPILQSTYNEIGIKLKLVPEPSSTLITRAFGSKNLPMYLNSEASSVLPTISNIAALYQTTGFANINNYSNKSFDEAANVALGTTNEAKLLETYDSLQRVAAEDPVYIAVAGTDGMAAMSSNISGYFELPNKTVLFQELSVSGS